MKPRFAALVKLSSNAVTITLVVVLIGSAASLFAWSSSRQAIDTLERERLTSRAKILEGALEERLSTYEEVLRGCAALLRVRDNAASRGDWQRYAASLHIESRYSGLIAIGYAARVTAAGRTAFEKTADAESSGSSVIVPSGERSEYAPVTYIEPETTGSQNALGFDMFSEAVRREAMVSARDSGQPTLSRALKVQRGSTGYTTGIIIFLPVYRAEPTSVDERRAQLLGYVFAPIATDQLFGGIIGDEMPTSSRFVIYDTAQHSQESQLFATRAPLTSHRYTGRLSPGTAAWQVRVSPDDALLTSSEQGSARMSLVAGLVGTALAAIFVRSIFRSRARIYAYEQQAEIQAAKDELLSLASHQLRTPATGVKQYLGMVLEGYAGPVEPQQRDMLEKAFASNERQLEIVGQILHVTRLEKGHLPLRPMPLDVTRLILDSIDEQRDSAAKKRQRIVFQPGKRHLHTVADPQYLRMAVENLLSNAIKYTHPRGIITMSVRRRHGELQIAVHDTGVGISSRDFPRLFQKFSRIDNELSIQEGGSGIGLYLIKQIVELHDGYIEVESQLGRGSTFRLVLPGRKNKK